MIKTRRKRRDIYADVIIALRLWQLFFKHYLAQRVYNKNTGIFKLSQNRDDSSYQNIVKHLKESGDTEARKVAEEMIKRRPQLF